MGDAEGPETSEATRVPKVFISYSHDSETHEDRVLDLANRLRDDGIDAEIDQYEDAPPEGWPAWCERHIKSADFVLLVCTETYLRRVDGEEAPDIGHGVLWEARIIRQLLYDARSVSAKFVPVLFSDGSPDHIPTVVKGAARFVVDDEKEYEHLYRLLTAQPRVVKPVLGKLKTLPPKKRKSSGSVADLQQQRRRAAEQAQQQAEEAREWEEAEARRAAEEQQQEALQRQRDQEEAQKQAVARAPVAKIRAPRLRPMFIEGPKSGAEVYGAVRQELREALRRREQDEAGRPFLRDVDAPWCPEMVALPAGEFLMGSPESAKFYPAYDYDLDYDLDKEPYDNEWPQHRVTIGYRFALGRYLITFAQYDHFCAATNQKKPGDFG